MAQPDDTLALVVARLYDTAFDRYPDLGGAENWARVLASGASLRSVADRFFSSAEFTARHAGQDDAAFVRSLYRDALERDADEAGLANWLGLLAGGTSRSEVFFQFLECEEQKAGFSRSEVRGVEGFDPDDGASPTERLVARLYDTAFDRLPDAGGAATWADVLASGASLRDVAGSFFASAEFTARHAGQDDAAFVRSLYRDALEREPDAAGLANWVGRLAAGTSRFEVFLAFLDSEEQKRGFSHSIAQGVSGASPPPPNPLDAVDDAYATTSGVELVVGAAAGLLANDVSPDGPAFPTEIGFFGTARGGSVNVDADGSFTYTPPDGFVGVDSFTYTIRGPSGSQDTATVRITVGPDRPVDAVDDSYAVVGNSGVNTFSAAQGLLANDGAPDGGLRVLGFVLGGNTYPTLATASGFAQVGSDGTFSYTPVQGFTGTERLTYRVRDANGSTDDATVTITVAPGVPMDAVDDAYTVLHDSNGFFTGARGVLANDTAPSGGLRVLGLVSGNQAYGSLATANGSLISITADGSLSFTPAPGFTGTETLTYRAQDANGSTDDATITVTVSPGTPADAVDDAYTVLHDSQTNTFSAAQGVLANDSAPDGGLRVVGFVLGGSTYPTLATANGSASIRSDGSFDYRPVAGFTGTETLTYRVQDADGSTDDATITITVRPGLPVDAVDDAYETTSGVELVVGAAAGLLANDVSPDGRPFPTEIGDFTTARGGNVDVGSDGSFVYTPPDGFVGVDSFTYTILDPDGSQDTATVRITVGPDRPVDAVDDAYVVQRNSGTNAFSAAQGVLANDSAPDGGLGVLGFVLGGTTYLTLATANGYASIRTDGSFDYTPAQGFSGTDRLTYRVRDANGSTDDATITITVDPGVPVDAVDDAYTVLRNSFNFFTGASGLLANDTAPSGGLTVLGLVSAGQVYGSLATTNGSLASITADGSLSFTPALGFAGTETLTYRVRDASGSTDDATVTITVSPGTGGNPVDAVDDSYTVARNAPATVFGGTQGVLANDTGADGGLEVLGFVSSSQPLPQRGVSTLSGGSAYVEATGQLTYQPAAGFTGTETLTYRLQDADGSTDDATITFTVGSGGGNPVDAVDDAYRTNRGVPLLVAAARGLLANDSAPDGGAAAGAGSFTTAQGGNVAVQASGAFLYTPPSGFTGTDSFGYQLTDRDGSTDTATATITVAVPTPIPPVQLSDVALGTGGRRIRGELGSYGRAGNSVAGVGDLDGDGRPDLLIGAPNLTVYLGASPYRVVTGAAYLVFSSGGVTDLGAFNPFINPAGSNGGFRIVAEGGPDQAGQSVAGAGDVNGDGIPDLVVGAPGNDVNTATPYNDGAGVAYVVFGKRGAGDVDLAVVAGGSGGFKMIGVRTGDLAGISVSGAGDVNGDGLADVLVGAPFADVGGYLEGAAYVVFGKAGTAPVNLADVAAGVGGFVINGQAGGSGSGYYAGSSVSSAGDMNGDGLADVLVGDENAGAAYVVFGKADTAAVDLGAVAAGAGGFRIANAGRPARVANAGDVNGDGIPDVVVGASASRPVSTALGTLATVVFGKADGAEVGALPGDPFAGFRVVGLDDVTNLLGAAVSAAGDLNGDGLGDVLIGAPGAYGDKAYVVFGKTDTADVNTADLAAGIGGFKILPEGAFDVLGISVSAAGDANGDGLDDLLVGSWASVGTPYQPGATYLIYGSASWTT